VVRALPVLLLLACSTVATTPADARPPKESKVSLNELSLTALDGSPFDVGALRGKAVLFVNVASKCGFTPQYEGLQALYERYAPRGLVIVGVPCNQFAAQEPGSPEEIASFCKLNYGVTFPLLEKQDVNGANRSPLYHFLIDSPTGAGAAVKWNFEKFLVSPAGAVVARFGSKTTPQDPALIEAIEKALPSAR
jgi:glutathione peroxidase